MTLKSPIVIFILGIVVGVGVASAVFRGNLFQEASADTGQIATTTSQLPPASTAVAVADQSAGLKVAIDSVTVPPPGVWAAVQELRSDNTVGNVLGAARFRGPRSDVDVPLLRATVPGHRYAVVLYRDDGDEAFTVAGDSLYVDFDTGDRVIAPFTAH